MAILVYKEYKIETVLNLNLYFEEESSDKSIELRENNIYTITFTDRKGNLITKTGKLNSIIIKNEIKSPYSRNPEQTKITLVLDVSDTYNSNLLNINLDDVRDVERIVD